MKPKNHHKKAEREWENHPGGMRLNKYIAHCGVCSRRDAAQLVKSGKVKVNGKQEIAPGRLVLEEDIVSVNGKAIELERDYVYFLMNKPKNTITTVDDPQGRKTVMEIIEKDIKERIFPVGRLDRNTTGLLLLTNDGALTNKLTHPSHEISKVYEITLDRPFQEKDLEKVRNGVTLNDGVIKVDIAHILRDKGENVVQFSLHSGRNRIVRRICEQLGYQVRKLDRTYFAGMTKKSLKRGWYRALTTEEIRRLKYFKQL